MQGWFLDKWQVFRCHVQKLNFLSFQSWVCIIHSPLPLGVVVTQTIFHVICIERTVLIKSPWGCKDVVEWWYGNNQNGCSSQGENKELRTQERSRKRKQAAAKIVFALLYKLCNYQVLTQSALRVNSYIPQSWAAVVRKPQKLTFERKKISQNVSFQFVNFGIFHQFLSY